MESEEKGTMDEVTKIESSDHSNSSSPPIQRPTTSSRPNRQHRIATSRYKGVVPQHNGHYGAQIYANHQRVWLGTFKTEEAAATAYDSAAIQLRSGNTGDPHRNFPWTAFNEYEAPFQAQYTKDQVLNMIKDGSYQTKFGEYLYDILQGGGSQTNPNNDQRKQEGYFCQELFRKELTPSDVGKLNRLVIPKRYALKFFSNSENGGLELEEGDMELTLYDKSMRGWKFRYCYWKSSQSFVFTRGWNKFVKEKDLKAKDIVVFYTCHEFIKGNNGNDVKQFCMIDIVASNNGSQSPNNNSSVRLEERIHEENASLREGESTLTNKKEEKGFRLFGVNIEICLADPDQLS